MVLIPEGFARSAVFDILLTEFFIGNARMGDSFFCTFGHKLLVSFGIEGAPKRPFCFQLSFVALVAAAVAVRTALDFGLVRLCLSALFAKL
jgi:hypothetical protein